MASASMGADERVLAECAPEPLSAAVDFGQLVGASAALTQAVQRARLLSRVSTPLLLQGETGVGKEVFARAIHEGGPAPRGPFVAVSCAGLPSELLASELFGYADGASTPASPASSAVRRSSAIGKLEEARGGTLFLDDVLDLPLTLQPYLLRVLEERVVYPIDGAAPRQPAFRVIAACNRDPWKEVTAGRFRMDLFYRLSATNLRVPPLRQRTEDIPLLIAHFLSELAQREAMRVRPPPEALLSQLQRYAWPGNVRELRNFVESAALLAAAGDADGIDLGTLDAGALSGLLQGPCLDAEVPDSEPAPLGLKRAERDAIGAALRMRGGNLTQVARELRIARSTLYLKVKKYGLDEFVSELRGRSDD